MWISANIILAPKCTNTLIHHRSHAGFLNPLLPTYVSLKLTSRETLNNEASVSLDVATLGYFFLPRRFYASTEPNGD